MVNHGYPWLSMVNHGPTVGRSKYVRIDTYFQHVAGFLVVKNLEKFGNIDKLENGHLKNMGAIENMEH